MFDLYELDDGLHHVGDFLGLDLGQVLADVEAEETLHPGHPLDHGAQLGVQQVLREVQPEAGRSGMDSLREGPNSLTWRHRRPPARRAPSLQRPCK